MDEGDGPAPADARRGETERWLTAEVEDGEDVADAAFRVVWAGHLHPDAPAGFAQRVVSEDTGSRSVPSRSSGVGRAVLRTLLGVAAGIAGVVGVIASTPWLVSISVGLVRLSARGIAWVVQALQSGLDIWTILGRLGQAIGSALTTPAVIVTFVGLELLGVAALYALHRLLRRGKEHERW